MAKKRDVPTDDEFLRFLKSKGKELAVRGMAVLAAPGRIVFKIKVWEDKRLIQEFEKKTGKKLKKPKKDNG